MTSSKLLVGGLLVAATLCLAPLSAKADEEFKGGDSSFGEVGVTLGTPGGINLNLGYWSSSSFPWLLRASGGYLGAIVGAQADFGIAFDKEGIFRQYVSLSGVY